MRHTANCPSCGFKFILKRACFDCQLVLRRPTALACPVCSVRQADPWVIYFIGLYFGFSVVQGEGQGARYHQIWKKPPLVKPLGGNKGLLPGGQELKLISLLSIVVALTHSSCCFSRQLHKGIVDGYAAVSCTPWQ